ncbi:MAG: DegT/DnrJ/EryC1/StrS family aminotransferase [Patescibacteria group bacterium]
MQRIPWWQPNVGTEKERAYLEQAFASNFINDGPLTTEFENQIAQRLGCRYAVAVTSGTSAIFLGLKALGIGHGDEVLIPDLTFIATANAAEMCGAKPVLVDVDPRTLTMSIPALTAAITSRTKAIVPVHVTGRAADMDAILAIANEHHLAVVEDAAEALLSKHNGRFLGTFGEAGCFSFSPNKTITTGQGGMIVTNDESLHRTIRMLKDQGRPMRGSGGDDRHEIAGYNFKFTDLQAAVGLGQLEMIERRIARMRRNYEVYAQKLAGVSGIELYPADLVGGAVPQWTDAHLEKRDGLAAYLKEKNIDSRNYWFPLHQQQPYLSSDEQFPNSTRCSPLSLWLPSAFSMTDEEVLTVANAVKEFLR